MQALLSAILISCFGSSKLEDTSSQGNSETSDTGGSNDNSSPDTGATEPPVDTGAPEPDTGTSDPDTGSTEDTGTSDDSGGSSDTAAEDTAVEDTAVEDTATSSAQSELSLCSPSHSDWYDLAALEMDGAELLVTLSYSGGCETHSWELCWDGSVAESYPMQVWLELGHDSGNDACEAYITETLRFDVTSIGTTPTIIHLGGMQTTYQ
jgi:hypothetical protein